MPAPHTGPLLRLNQITEGPGRYRVEIALEGKNLPRQIATAHFPFALSREDQVDLRWYLETYLQYPLDPNPTIAAAVERSMTAIGTQLFRAVFQSDDDVRDLWATLRPRLKDTRIEIITEAASAGAIPWELLRDPKIDTPLALRVGAFVYAHPQPAQPPRMSSTTGPIRILLVICRPGHDDDVPFRSVAGRLIKSLNDEARAAFTEDERKVLALLHLFQGFVQVGSLQAMGHPEIGNLAEVRGLTREAGMALLDRAADVGLLTAHGGGYYSLAISTAMRAISVAPNLTGMRQFVILKDQAISIMQA